MWSTSARRITTRRPRAGSPTTTRTSASNGPTSSWSRPTATRTPRSSRTWRPSSRSSTSRSFLLALSPSPPAAGVKSRGDPTRLEPRPHIVPPAHIALQQHVEDDEGVAAAHLPQVELRLADAPSPPGDRHDPVAVSSHDRLQRDLNGQIEVVGEQGLDRVDHLPLVGLEGIGRVVVAVAEEHPDPPVDHPVEDQLEPRV